MPSQTDKKEIQSLLANLRKGLEHYSVNELNQAIKEVLSRKKTGSRTDLDMVFDIIYSEYKIVRKTLMQKRLRNQVNDARLLAYGLMHHVLGLSMRHIAISVFRCTPNTVMNGINIIKNMEPNKFKQDRLFIERFNRCKLQLTEMMVNK